MSNEARQGETMQGWLTSWLSWAANPGPRTSNDQKGLAPEPKRAIKSQRHCPINKPDYTSVRRQAWRRLRGDQGCSVERRSSLQGSRKRQVAPLSVS